MSEHDEVDFESLRSTDPENATEYGPEPYKSPDNLRTLYWELEWSQGEIAEFYDVSQATISRAMEKAGVETRPSMDERERRGIYRNERPDSRTQFFIDNFGGSGDDEIVTFYESYLVALERYPLSLVTREDTEVDHWFGSPLHINLPGNLEVLPKSHHQADHSNGRDVSSETFLEQIGVPVDPDVDSRQTVYITPSAASTVPSANQQESESETVEGNE